MINQIQILFKLSEVQLSLLIYSLTRKTTISFVADKYLCQHTVAITESPFCKFSKPAQICSKYVLQLHVSVKLRCYRFPVEDSLNFTAQRLVILWVIVNLGQN